MTQQDIPSPPHREPATTTDPSPDPIWMRVRSLGIDRATRTVGALLAGEVGDGPDDGELLFVPLSRAGAASIAGARRYRSVEPGLALLLGVISSLGARLEHVVLTLGPPEGEHGHPSTRTSTAELVLSDGSAITSDSVKGLELSVHAGVPVGVLGTTPEHLLLPAEQGRERYTAAVGDPVEESVSELRRLLDRAHPHDFEDPV